MSAAATAKSPKRKAATPKPENAAPPAKAESKPKAAPKPKVSEFDPKNPRYREAADRLKLVSDPGRLAVLAMLSQGPRNVTEISGAMAMSQPAVSHHLALMRHAGVVTPTREGKTNIYALTDAGRKLAATILPTIAD